MTDRFGLLYDASFDQELILGQPDLDFLEIIPDRFMTADWLGEIPECLMAKPTVFHSLNLSLGSDEALDGMYLAHLSELARQFMPMWASDHLAFTHIDGTHLGHLSPIRWSTSSIEAIASKITVIQDKLRLPFLVENIAYYFQIPGADITEGELIQGLVEQTGCGVLLDLNNLAVNAANHGFDSHAYLREFPLQAVREIHIAGHRRSGKMYIDSHGEAVGSVVWDLLRFVAGKLESVNVVLERDQNVPPIGELMRELAIARKCVDECRKDGSESALVDAPPVP